MGLSFPAHLTGSVFWDDGLVLLSAARLTATNGQTMIGAGGLGQITTSNSLLAMGDVTLGTTSVGRGLVSVAGSNSIWTSYKLCIGQSGTSNRLDLTGGQMSDTSAQIGSHFREQQ